MTFINRRLLLGGALATGVVGVSATAKSSRASLMDTIDAYAQSSKYNGVIVAGVGNRIQYHRAFGLADFARKNSMQQDTVFEGGSTSKWIASLVVLKLCDLGLLSLRVPISTYLPDYRQDRGKLLTLEHLMSHSSGIPNQVIPALEANLDLYKQPIDQAEAVRRYASGDLQFAPGSRWQYSHLSIGVQKGPPIGVQKGPPFVEQRDGYVGRTFRAGGGVGRA